MNNNKYEYLVYHRIITSKNTKRYLHTRDFCTADAKLYCLFCKEEFPHYAFIPCKERTIHLFEGYATCRVCSKILDDIEIDREI
jgi:hypothetical protein